MENKNLIDALSREYVYNSSEYESASGVGSTLHATRLTRPFIERVVKDYNVKSIVDIPCGDFNWMKKVSLPLECSYKGFDIVKKMVDDNSTKFPHLFFESKNAIEDHIPKSDLIISRDFMFHLPNKNIFKVLENFINSGSKYLICTTYPRLAENNDLPENNIEYGWGFREINLEIEPFNIKGIVDQVDEEDFSRKMILVDLHFARESK